MNLTKNFLLAVFSGILALGLFVYFLFGFSGPSVNVVTSDISQVAPPSKQETVKIQDLKVGTGPAVKSGDTVVIDYTGTLTNGTKFDSSLDRGTPFETKIGVGQVIKGWDIGVIGMKVGGQRKLTIPPSLGYGEQGQGSIPPNATLIFTVELRQIK